MLNFIGTGSAFNTNLGNNGAYIKDNNELFLIDCGSSTFSRLMSWGILDDIESINVLITHTHPDHIGSLGDLVFYSYYCMKPILKTKINIYYPYCYPDRQMQVINHLENVGVPRHQFRAYEINKTEIIYSGSYCIEVKPLRVEHAKDIPCFGYILKLKDKTIYYSGDANMIPDKVLEMLYNDSLDKLYQDTCIADYQGNVHLSLNKLQKLISPEYRHKVYCMHFDKGFDYSEALRLGFNLAIAKGV